MKWYEDKEYREMCEEAEKIQDDWTIETGAYVFALDAREVFLVVNASRIHEQDDTVELRNVTGRGDATKSMDNLIWLPSQEDLQEMIDGNLNFKLGEFLRLHFILVSDYRQLARRNISVQFTSMNQLWLAFVMHELYQENWNPETKKWEKTEK